VRSLPPSLLCLALSTLSHPLFAAQPDSATYRADADDLIWFLAVTDPHIGANLWGGLQDTDNLNFATSELVETVEPRFLANLGDLVDGTGGGLIPVGQFDEEWSNYQTIVEGNGMTPDFYYDLPGNHDQYGDPGLPHYLAYSVQGKATGQLRHAWTVETQHSRFLFLGMRTCNSDGAFWPVDQAGLQAEDIQWAQGIAAANAEAQVMTVLGHHPVSGFEFGSNEFKDFLEQEGASAYLYGHTHDYAMKWIEQTLHVNLASLGKSKQLQIGLFAYDGRGLSARAFDAGDWPMLLITAPLHAGLAGNHKHDYKVPDYMAQAPIRAIAFHPDGIDSVTAMLDSTTEIPMVQIADHVWQGHFDATKLDLYPHEIVVTATHGSEKDSQMIEFYTVHEDPPVVEEDDCHNDCDAGIDANADAGMADGTGNPEEVDAGGTAENGFEELTSEAGGADSAAPADGTLEAGPEWDSPLSGEGYQAEGEGPAPSQPGVTGHIPAKKSGGCSAGTAGTAASWPLGLLGLLALLGLCRRIGRSARRP